MDTDKMPQHLKGLLNFCLKEGSEQKFEEMDPERAQFLRNVLQTINVDVVKQLKKRIQNVLENMNSSEDEDISFVLSNLDDILYTVENMDLAMVFIKADGLLLLKDLSTSPNSEYKQAAAAILAAVVQNNIEAQKIVLNNEILIELVKNIESSDDLGLVKQNILALSCSIRGYPNGLSSFIKLDKLESLTRRFLALYETKKEDEKSGLLSSIFTKFSFFVFAIVGEMSDEDLIDFRSVNNIQTLIAAMTKAKPMEDFLSRALNRLAVDLPKNEDVDEYKQSFVNFKKEIVPKISQESRECLGEFIKRKLDNLDGLANDDFDEDIKQTNLRLKSIFL